MERTGARRRTTFGRQGSEGKLGECVVFCEKMEESVVMQENERKSDGVLVIKFDDATLHLSHHHLTKLNSPHVLQ